MENIEERNISIEIAFTDDELDQVMNDAKVAGYEYASDYIRAKLFGYGIKDGD